MEIVVEKNPREHEEREEKQNAYEEWVYKEWVNSIKRKIPTSPSHPRNPDTAIFRVPEHIRGGNENAYEPKVVSIGPYHRAREKLVDKHKWRYVQAILQRNPNKSLEDYLNGIKKLEDRARSCYRETTEIQKIESNEFVEMMFVDGCFLVELFLKRFVDITNEKERKDQDDIIGSDQLLNAYLQFDLCLLENQLPYFILECIFESVTPNDLTTYFEKFPTMREHFDFFKKILSSDKDASALLASLAITFIPSHFIYNIRSSDVADGEKKSFHHLLHLFHYSLSPDPDIHLKKKPVKSIFSCLCSHGSASPAGDKPKQLPGMPSGPTASSGETAPSGMPSGPAASLGETAPSKSPSLRSPEKCEPLFSVPSVTKLEEAGVKFRRAKNPRSTLYIKCKCGVMKIPHFVIDNSVNLFFRNLIAFEQCHQRVPPSFSEYAALMDRLINTPKDVKILRQYGIIEHMLGSDEEVVLLFNRLCNGIIIYSSNRYFSILLKKVNSSKCWPRSRATVSGLFQGFCGCVYHSCCCLLSCFEKLAVCL